MLIHTNILIGMNEGFMSVLKVIRQLYSNKDEILYYLTNLKSDDFLVDFAILLVLV